MEPYYPVVEKYSKYVFAFLKDRTNIDVFNRDKVVIEYFQYDIIRFW